MKTISDISSSIISDALHDQAIISDTSFDVIAEWNMNAAYPSTGINDVSGGDDLYVVSLPEEDRQRVMQNPELARQFSKPWREGNGIALFRAFSGSGEKSKVLSNPNVRTYAFGKEGSYSYWTSPIPSSPVSASGWRCDGNALLVATPAPSSNEFIKVLGFFTEANKIKFLVNKEFPNTNGISIQSQNGAGLSSYGVKVTGDFVVTAQSKEWVNSRVYRASAKGTNVLYFGSYNSSSKVSPIVVGQKIKSATVGGTSPTGTWNSWSALVTGVSELRAPNGSYWTQVFLSKAVPTNVDSGQIFSTEMNVVSATSTGVAQITDKGYVPGTFAHFTFNRIQALSGLNATASVTSTANNSSSVNVAINNLSKTGGGAIRFSSNITLTEPIIIPSNSRVKFDGVITCSPGFSSLFEYAVYFTNVSPFVNVISAVFGNNFIDINPSTPAEVKSRIVTNSTLAIKVPSEIEVLSEGRSIKTKTEKIFTYKVKSISGNRVTIYGTVSAGVSDAPMYVSSPVDVSNVIGNSYIDGGTWNLDGGVAKRAGFLRVANANGIRISRATINNASNIDTVSVAGCNNVILKSLVVQNTLHDEGTDAAGISLSSHKSRDLVDACFNVVIEKCKLSGKTGISSYVLSNSETSRHKTIRIIDNVINCETGIDLADVGHCAISSNTINASGNTGVSITSARSACTNNLINSNSITLGSDVGDRAIILAGTNSTRPVVYSRIINNSITGGESQKRIHLFATCFTQIYGNTGVLGSSTIVGDQNAETYYSSATIYGVRHSAPTVQYVEDRSEVVGFKQWGERITIVLAKPIQNVRVGSYLFITDVHESINGSRKVIGFSKDRSTITLKSQISGISPSGSSAEYNLMTQDDDYGYAFLSQPVPANKIVVKFETSYGTPNSCFIQVKNNSSWQTVYSMASSLELSDESELDLYNEDNIKTLTIYRDESGSWSRSESNFDIVSSQNITSVDAVRVVIGSTTTNGALVSVTEISARLQADMKRYVKSWSVDSELDSSERFAPIGTAVTSGGTIDLDNSSHIFDKYNKSSPFSNLFSEPCVFHIYSVIAGEKIKLATMLSDTWEDESVSLIDKSYILQSQKARDMFAFGGWDNNGISVKSAVSGILDSIGFGNYKFYDDGGLGRMKFVYTKEEDSPWDVLKEIAEVHQFALVFDRLGRLQIMSRKHLYNRNETDYLIVGDNLRSKMINRTDYFGYGGAYSHNNFFVKNNFPLPAGATKSDTDSLAVLIKKEPEFFVNDCWQSGNTVTMRLIQSNPDLQLQSGNNKFYISGMGEAFDGFRTLTSGPTLSGEYYTITYSVPTAASIPVNNDYPGVVGYAENANVAFLATGLTAGKLYRYTGMMFIPENNSSEYSAMPAAFGAEVQYGQEIYSTKEEPIPFNLSFVATSDSQYIGFTINKATSDDELIIYDDDVLFADVGLEDGYDSVIEGSIKNLIPASKVIVSYTSANQYKEATTELGGLLELGKNATLWEMPELIIPSLSVDILNWTTFKFSVEAGGYSSSSVSIGDSVNMAGSPKELDYLGIPFKGQFFFRGKFMKYLGVEASAPYATPPKKQIITSLDDLLSIREANNGIAPKWTGKGFFAWNYPPASIHYPGADIRVKVGTAPTVAQVPSLSVSPSVNLDGVIVRPGSNATSVVWEPRVKRVETLGGSFDVNTGSVSSGSVALFLSGSRYKHTVGVSWSQDGSATPYGVTVPVSGAQAEPLQMVMMGGPPMGVPKELLHGSNIEVRIISTKINTVFYLYIGKYLVGVLQSSIILDDLGAGIKAGIVMSAGLTGSIKRLYIIEGRPPIPPTGTGQEVYLFGLEQQAYTMDRVEF